MRRLNGRTRQVDSAMSFFAAGEPGAVSPGGLYSLDEEA